MLQKTCIGLVFNHEVSHWNRPRPYYHRPYEEHYKDETSSDFRELVTRSSDSRVSYLD